jgi:hypothetical protein
MTLQEFSQILVFLYTVSNMASIPGTRMAWEGATALVRSQGRLAKLNAEFAGSDEATLSGSSDTYWYGTASWPWTGMYYANPAYRGQVRDRMQNVRNNPGARPTPNGGGRR